MSFPGRGDWVRDKMGLISVLSEKKFNSFFLSQTNIHQVKCFFTHFYALLASRPYLTKFKTALPFYLMRGHDKKELFNNFIESAVLAHF